LSALSQKSTRNDQVNITVTAAIPKLHVKSKIRFLCRCIFTWIRFKRTEPFGLFEEVAARRRKRTTTTI